MAENKIVGYKKVFGFVMPDWVSEGVIKKVAIGLLSTVAILMVLIFVVRPNIDLLKTRQAELKSSKTALEVLKTSKEGLDRLTVDLSETDLARILSAMPQQYSPDEAIFSLRKISADTGVSIISYILPSGVLLDTTGVAPKGKETEMVGFVTFPIRITVEAPVEQLLKFIAEVESSLPYGIVSDLNLQEVTKLSRVAGDKTVQMALEIRFFESMIRNVNINKLQPFTEADLNLAKELRGYNLMTVPDYASSQIINATGSGSVFGF